MSKLKTVIFVLIILVLTSFIVGCGNKEQESESTEMFIANIDGKTYKLKKADLVANPKSDTQQWTKNQLLSQLFNIELKIRQGKEKNADYTNSDEYLRLFSYRKILAKHIDNDNSPTFKQLSSESFKLYDTLLKDKKSKLAKANTPSSTVTQNEDLMKIRQTAYEFTKGFVDRDGQQMARNITFNGTAGDKHVAEDIDFYASLVHNAVSQRVGDSWRWKVTNFKKIGSNGTFDIVFLNNAEIPVAYIYDVWVIPTTDGSFAVDANKFLDAAKNIKDAY